MDPEDEHVHKLVDDYDACWHYCFDTLPMKLFEAEIRDNLGLHHGLWRMRTGAEDDDLEDRKEADKLQLSAAHGFIELYHTRRFFATIDGFHKGSLDLTGRHKPRYERLRKRFDDIVNHFTFVSNRCVWLKPRFYGEEDVFVFDPPDLWDNFLDKWKIGSMFDCKTFKRDLNNVQKTIAQQPQPQYQTLLLLHLPAELLDDIMSLSTGDQLKRWSLTCQTLRIHAIVYMHETVSYILDAMAIDWSPADDLPDNDGGMGEFVRKNAYEQRDALEQRMRNMAAQPKVLRRIRSLGFVESWSAEIYNWLNFIGTSCLKFVNPLLTPLAAHIRDSSIEEFTYVSRYLYGTVWREVAKSKTLHTLDLVTSLPKDPKWPRAPNIRNLDLTIPATMRYTNMWSILMVCPGLLYLCTGGVLTDGVVLPERILRSVDHNPMKHLRRVDMNNIAAPSLVHLAAGIRGADPAPLTHLSISCGSRSHIKRDVAFTLTQSFRSAPHLRVLHLTGLQYARPDLFELLGECAPGLHALAIYHRPSIFRLSKAPAHWPCPSYEYAPHLAAFPHLEHLALNMSVLEFSHSSQYMLRIENGYVGAEREDDIAMLAYMMQARLLQRNSFKEKQPLVEELFGDDLAPGAVRAMVRLFAIHGSALRSIFLHDPSKPVRMSAWAVDRDSSGCPCLRNDWTEAEEAAEYHYGSMQNREGWKFTAQEIKDVVANA
ncbi:hypothetical protein FB107DRAFT_272893 [Schizophyllum commune]